ncbi:MAG: hypothetical protein GEU98_17140 [Pseudonocardiaceae bacterium]|nr:hypothetical protein [Pseudonocardiaceae bacterium]
MRSTGAGRLLAAVLFGFGLTIGAAAPAMAAPALPAIAAQDDDGGGDDDGGNRGDDDGAARGGDDDSADDGAVPRGGVETGFGGTADEAEVLLPLSVVGGTALAAAGGVLLVRRRLGNGNG